MTCATTEKIKSRKAEKERLNEKIKMVRTPSCDKTGLKKGTWTPEEDRKLMAYVTRYGYWNWRQLPKYAGLSRCGKSCRLRWLNYLRPNIKRGNYTKEEEDTIIRLHESLGNRWSAIAAQLPGRTDNEIKNHWHTNLKKRIQKGLIAHDQAKAKSRGQSSHQQKKIQKEDTNKLKVDATNPTAPQIITESPTMSPKPSTSDLSSMTADNNIAVTSSSDLKYKDDEFAFLAAYESPSGNFWTEPFLADNYSYLPNEFLPSLLDSPSPILDGEIVYSYVLGDQCEGLNW